MTNSVIVSPSSHFVVITTIIVYALLAPIFFEMDNVFGEEKTLWMMATMRRHIVNK